MKPAVFAVAVTLTTWTAPVQAERVPMPSDEELIASADYCVVGTLTRERRLRVDTRVFGDVPVKAVRVTELQSRTAFEPGATFVVYLVQNHREVRPPSLGFREVVNGEVVTSNRMSNAPRHVAEIRKNEVPFPSKLEAYVAEVRKREAAVRAKRHAEQREALEAILSWRLYEAGDWDGVSRLLNGPLHRVHADDETTLGRMARFIRERPKSIDMRARAAFVNVIARKNHRAGFDAIRLEAARNNRAGNNWGSERAAIHALGRIGTADDIGLLRTIILVQGQQRGGTLLRAAFPAFATLVVRHHAGEKDVLARERTWVTDHPYDWHEEALSVFEQEAAESAAATGKGGKAAGQRAALWKALSKALPDEHREIDVYAENPSLTAVLFRSQGATLQFSLRTKKVETVQGMKRIPPINRITYENRGAGAYWALWYDGKRETTIAAGE